MTSQEAAALSALIDSYGLPHVVTCLVTICQEQGLRLRESDPGSSMTWVRQANVIATIVEKL